MKKEIDAMLENALMDELLELEPIEADSGAIYEKVQQKLNDEKTIRLPKQRKKPVKWLRVTIAAAIATVAMATAVVAGTAIYRMVQGSIEYFEDGEPLYYASQKESYEGYTAEVGITVSDAGIDVTLDSVAVDDNFITAYFTVKYPEPLVLGQTEYGSPAWDDLIGLTPYMDVQIDGRSLFRLNGYQNGDNYDPYQLDESTVRYMVHVPTPTLLPDTFTLTLKADGIRTQPETDSVKGNWNFTVMVDATEAKAATYAADPGVYTFATGKGERYLDIQKLAQTPFGTVLSLNGHWAANDLNQDEAYLQHSDLFIQDDEGNPVYPWWNNMVGGGADYYALELIGADPATRSFTVTPVSYIYDAPDEYRSFTPDDIGKQLPTSELGGLIFESYKVEGQRIEMVFQPYGYTRLAVGIVPDDDHVSLNSTNRSALVNWSADRVTGKMTYTLDYYAATEEELLSIPSFHYSYSDCFQLEEDAATVIELAPLQ